MRGAIEQCHTAGAAAHDFTFFEGVRQKIDGEALLLGFHNRLPAANVKYDCSLFEVARDENIGFGQQTRDELRPEGGRIIEKDKRLSASARNQRIKSSELAFESRL